MVHEGTGGLLARIQRDAQQGRPPKAEREEALALCTLCDWTARGERRSITVLENPLQDQQRIYDALYVHAVGAHDADSDAITARDCDDVRDALRVPRPNPPRGQARYLRCTARLYVLSESDPAEALRDAYHVHWELCPATEATRRSQGPAVPSESEIVYTRGDPLLPHWRYVP